MNNCNGVNGLPLTFSTFYCRPHYYLDHTLQKGIVYYCRWEDNYVIYEYGGGCGQGNCSPINMLISKQTKFCI